MLKDYQKKFFQLVTDPAISSQMRCGIPAAVTIAQAILESGWGRSQLFKLANNPFGIKYSDSSPYARYGEVEMKTHEFIQGHNEIVTAGFQHFGSLHDAFRCHARLLQEPRYAAAYRHRGDARLYAICLGPKSEKNPQGCDYATDPEYGRKLVTLIDDYDLENAGEHYGLTVASDVQIAEAHPAEGGGRSVAPQNAPSVPPAEGGAA